MSLFAGAPHRHYEKPLLTAPCWSWPISSKVTVLSPLSLLLRLLFTVISTLQFIIKQQVGLQLLHFYRIIYSIFPFHCSQRILHKPANVKYRQYSLHPACFLLKVNPSNVCLIDIHSWCLSLFQLIITDFLKVCCIPGSLEVTEIHDVSFFNFIICPMNSIHATDAFHLVWKVSPYAT